MKSRVCASIPQAAWSPCFLFRAWFLQDLSLVGRSQASLSIIVLSWVLLLMGIGVSFLKNKKLFLFPSFVVPGLNCSTRDLVPRPGIEPRPPALGAQSLSYQGSRSDGVSWADSDWLVMLSVTQVQRRGLLVGL